LKEGALSGKIRGKSAKSKRSGGTTNLGHNLKKVGKTALRMGVNNELGGHRSEINRQLEVLGVARANEERCVGPNWGGRMGPEENEKKEKRKE